MKLKQADIVLDRKDYLGANWLPLPEKYRVSFLLYLLLLRLLHLQVLSLALFSYRFRLFFRALSYLLVLARAPSLLYARALCFTRAWAVCEFQMEQEQQELRKKARESILDNPSLRHETCESLAATPTNADSIKMSPTHCNRLVPLERWQQEEALDYAAYDGVHWLSGSVSSA